jgi:hypothetical protein
MMERRVRRQQPQPAFEEQGLLESGYTRRDPDAVSLSRRRFILPAGVVRAATLALPVVHSIAAPTPAPASTASGNLRPAI